MLLTPLFVHFFLLWCTFMRTRCVRRGVGALSVRQMCAVVSRTESCAGVYIWTGQESPLGARFLPPENSLLGRARLRARSDQRGLSPPPRARTRTHPRSLCD